MIKSHWWVLSQNWPFNPQKPQKISRAHDLYGLPCFYLSSFSYSMTQKYPTLASISLNKSQPFHRFFSSSFLSPYTQHPPGFNSHLFATYSQNHNSTSIPSHIFQLSSLILQPIPPLGLLTHILAVTATSFLPCTPASQSLCLILPGTAATQFQPSVTTEECWPTADRWSAFCFLFRRSPKCDLLKET